MSVNHEFLNVLKSNQNPFTTRSLDFYNLCELSKRKNKSITYLKNKNKTSLKPNHSDRPKGILKVNCQSVIGEYNSHQNK